MNIPTKETKEYFYKFTEMEWARITFVKEEIWKFSHCDFHTAETTYTYQDWVFLGQVSDMIQEIKKELEA